jgi:hypothetical protein
MTLWDSFVLNAFGDAACALTPLRIGGEPARLAGMLRTRVPATAAFVAISLEVLAAWPVIIVAAGWLIWRYVPAWWLLAGPRLSAAAASAWPWVVVVAASVVACGGASGACRGAEPTAGQARGLLAAHAGVALVASLPLSFTTCHPRGDSSGAGAHSAQPAGGRPAALACCAPLQPLALPTSGARARWS